MNNIKIAFFDIDGTLANNDKIITEETYRALKYLKDNNILLALSSGRYDKHSLKYNKDNIFDYIICNNGAEILDINNNKVIYSEIINNKLDSIINFTKDNYEITLNSKDIQYTIYDNYDDKNIYQVLLLGKKRSDVDKVIEFTKNNNLKITYISADYYEGKDTGRYSIDINLSSTGKGNSIKKLLNILNIDKKNTICFGDNYNDINMFEECGIRVAMKNSCKELLDKADYVTLSNEENGVAYFINKYIKKQD